MRKQNKIVSLVLVLALLLGVFVIVPVQPVKASAADAGESFTPTATWSSAANANEAVASGNLFNTSTSLGNWNEESVSLQLVTTEGGDKYVTLVAKADKTTGNHYINVGTGSNSRPILDFTKSMYVIEMDIATDGDLIADFSINPIISHKNSAGYADRPDGSTGDFFDDHEELEDGKWHRYVVVGDLATNTVYIYIDGNLVKTTVDGAYNKTNKAKNPADTQYYVEGIRFNIGIGVAMVPGSSISVDNMTLKVVESGAYTAPSSPVATDYPAIAKVNGVEYSNIKGVNAALNAIFPATAELLRQFAGTVTVNCDATVETNGVSGTIVAGTNVTVEINDTVRIYDAPFKSSVTLSSITSTQQLLDTNLEHADNLITVRDHNTAAFNTNGVGIYIANASGIDNPYIQVQVEKSGAATTHSHFNTNINGTDGKLGRLLTANDVIVYDFDMLVDGAIANNLYFQFMGRSANASGGSPYGGNAFYPDYQNVSHSQYFSPVKDEWVHYTLIGVASTNKAYLYANGELIGTAPSGVYGSNTLDTAYLYGVRWNIANGISTNLKVGENFSLANESIRIYTDSNYSEGMSDLSTFNKNIFNSDYELPAEPVLATVDGEIFTSTSALSAALVGNTAKKVELYREPYGTVTVNCDATVETNHYTAPVAGTGVTSTYDGTLYTYDAPYAQSANNVTVTANNDIINAVKGNAAGNLFTSIQNNVQSANGMKTEVVTNTVQGGNYVKVSPNGTENNAYLEVQSITYITPNVNTQFYVFDMDVAILDSSVTVSLSTVPRVDGDGAWGAANPSLNIILAGCPDSEMQHVTAVVNMDTNTQYIFVNGNLVKTNAGNGYTSADNHTNGFAAGKTVKFDGYRIGSNLGGVGKVSTDSSIGYIVDNVNIRYYEDAASGYAADSLTAAMAAGNLSTWSDAITEISTETAPLATVDGEYVYSASALTAALNGRYAKKVEILRDETKAITVNCSATVETNGLNVNLVAGADIKSTSTEGTVTTYVAKWKASATEQTTSNGNFIIDSTVPGNLFAGKTGIVFQNNGANKMAMYQVTDVETGNTYLKLQPTVDDITGSNIYLTTEIIPGPGNTTADCVLKDGQGYYVYDLDIATDGNIIEMMHLAPYARNNASEVSTFPIPTSIPLKNYKFSDGEWMHMTIVGDMAANVQYVFINGSLAGTAGVANAQAGEYEYLNVKGYRMNLGAAAEISTDESILMDNLSARVYKTVGASNGLDAAIAAGSLAGWANNIYEGTNDKLPSVATVNGVEYSSVNALTAALSNGKNLSVSLDRAAVGTAYAATTATITTNGIANFIEGAGGYTVEDNGDGTYTVKIETRMGSITVKINGINAINANLLYGTDIAEYLADNHSYVGGILTAGGKIYTDAKWNVAPAGVVDGDEIYNVTATEYNGLYLAHTDGVVDSNAAMSIDGLYAQLTASKHVTVILGQNVTTDKTCSIPSYNKVIDLNGYTLNLTKADTSHNFDASGSGNLTIKNGTLTSLSRINTQQVFFSGYNYTGTVTFDNVAVITTGSFVTLRAGNLVVIDSTIDSVQTLDGGFIQLAENHNGSYTTTPITAIFENTVINHRSVRDYNRASFIVVTATPADSSVHTVDFVNCVINDINTETYSTNQGFVQATNANSVVNFKGCELRVQLLANANVGGVVNLLEGCSFASEAALVGTTVANGLAVAKTGKGNTPYVYTAKYATVVWANGTVEKWADGTTPISSANPYAQVQTVEAGVTYNFENAQSAPCSMKANLTLTDALIFNVYIPTSAANVKYVTINGVTYEVSAAEVVKLDGVEYYAFGYEVSATEAGGDILVTVVTDDATYTRALSVISYAELVYEQYASDANAVNLMSAVLNYVKAAYHYTATYVKDVYSAIDALLAAHPLTNATISGTATDMSAVNSIITSAQLHLTGSFKFRFNVADGADISDLKISVGGKEIDYVTYINCVEITLNASNMADVITVSVGGAEGTFNLYSYVTYVKTLAEGHDEGVGKSPDPFGSWNYHSVELLEALYNYAFYAAAYKA